MSGDTLVRLLEQHARERPHAEAVGAPGSLSAHSRIGCVPGPAISPTESPLMQANRRALRRYQPRKVQASLALLFAEQGPPEPAEEAEHALRRLTRGSVRLERVSAAHAGLLDEPTVGALAGRIEALQASFDGEPA